MKRKLFIALSTYFISIFVANAQTLYFPPTGSSWQTTSPASNGYCQEGIDSLYYYLGQKGTKGFILLKDGNIVLEKYYGTFTKDSLWYWASTGKTLTAMLVGIAQYDGLVDINNAVSTYLGNGWSSASTAEENAITVKQLLQMTSGLDDSPTGCTNEDDIASCLDYLTTPDSRWAYHTGAYRKLQDMIAQVSGGTINTYTNAKIKTKIGMSTGTFYSDVYYSRTRDMARFGLLLLNKGIWDTDTLLHDQDYFAEMTNSSQSYNPGYGYLTWLNGKSSYKRPGSQISFTGTLVPNAPSDMFAALGKNDQKIYVVPSQNLVVVRQGNVAYTQTLAISPFDNELWKYINQLTCVTSTSNAQADYSKVSLSPNPATDILLINGNVNKSAKIHVLNPAGQLLKESSFESSYDISFLKEGVYLLKIVDDKNTSILKFVKQ